MGTLRHTAIRSEGPSISDRAPGSTVSFYANREEAKKIVYSICWASYTLLVRRFPVTRRKPHKPADHEEQWPDMTM
jgi:hypothetical protein